MTLTDFNAQTFKDCASSYNQLSICLTDLKLLSPAPRSWELGKFGIGMIAASIATAVLLV